jgi:hypothetical protein
MTQTIHPRCAACGSRRQLRLGVCVYLCDEILPGWIYRNARDMKHLILRGFGKGATQEKGASAEYHDLLFALDTNGARQ